jgi:hypothetical protein
MSQLVEEELNIFPGKVNTAARKIVKPQILTNENLFWGYVCA